MVKTEARGIRNCNPGNIKATHRRWVGEADVQPDPMFVTFQSPVYGLRAMAVLLTRYQEDFNLWTVNGIIHRWAPPSENNTKDYVNNVCQWTNTEPDEPIDLKNPENMLRIMKGMVIQENGSNPYSDNLYREAIRKSRYV